MNRFAVELVGKSPILTNNCVVYSGKTGEFPSTDEESARSKLYDDGRALSNESVLTLVGWLTGTKAKPPYAAIEGGVRLDGAWTVHTVERVYAGYPLRWSYPRFDAWRATFTLALAPRWYDAAKVRELFTAAGPSVGLPQFTPHVVGGEWGRYEVTKWEAVDEQQIHAA